MRTRVLGLSSLVIQVDTAKPTFISPPQIEVAKILKQLNIVFSFVVRAVVQVGCVLSAEIVHQATISRVSLYMIAFFWGVSFSKNCADVRD